jgi:hypothetical protein
MGWYSFSLQPEFLLALFEKKNLPVFHPENLLQKIEGNVI